MAKKLANRREKSSSDGDSVVEVNSSSYEESSDNESSSSSFSSSSSSSKKHYNYKEIKVNNLFAISNFVLNLFTFMYYFYIYRKKSSYGLTPNSKILLPLIIN